jgi:hypothetical protein
VVEPARVQIQPLVGMIERVEEHAEGKLLFFGVAVALLRGAPVVPLRLLFWPICRTFLSGRIRIRTGDTMIFSHILRLLGMRICRIGERVSVHEVPSVIAWCRPYC